MLHRKGEIDMFANYHTHTPLCRHAQDSERAYVETAIARGMKVLGFSDHSPYLFPGEYYSGHRMFLDWVEKYFQTLGDLKKEYAKDITLHIGFEMEYYPRLFDKTLDFLASYPCEYLILGQHFLDNEYDTMLYSGAKTSNPAVLTQYVDQVLEALSTGKFTYVAHPDLIHFVGDPETYRQEITRMCQEIKRMGLPLEINGLGVRENRLYPSDRFYAIAKEVGNTVIIGCDAHCADGVGNEKDYLGCKAIADKFQLNLLEKAELRGPKSAPFH